MPNHRESMAAWRWRQDVRPGAPAWNMAEDAALLAEVRDDPAAPPIVRAYRWDRPCVSLGRFQDEAAVRALYPNVPLVRRPTGGRAVRHGDDLCVSIAARQTDLPCHGGVLASYRLLGGAVIAALCDIGLPAAFGQDRGRPHPGEEDCFATTTRCDILSPATGLKIAGCAQRRAGPALLQQMSLPIITPDLQGPFLTALRRHLTDSLGVSSWFEVSCQNISTDA